MQATEALVIDLPTSSKIRPGPYDGVVGGWRTNLPRLPVREDAVSLGLIQCKLNLVACGEAGKNGLAAQP